MFRNRLEKVYRHLRKTAKREGVSCWRVYDHDLPEFPLVLEIYEDRLSIAEYKRRHQLSEEDHAAWLAECRRIAAAVLGIDEANVFFRTRQRKEGRQGQYQRQDSSRHEFIARENGLQFIVNLSDYLDTGLFLDHRLTRQLVREQSRDKKVLNLFCYTGSFSVYALAGGAAEVVSVDLSKTYLDWCRRNVQENFGPEAGHRAVHADVKAYLKEQAAGSFDLIVMDPPTFSNSKRMEDILDIQRDHPGLINDCLRLLSPGGLLYFSTNFTRFSLDADRIRSAQVRDITRVTTPFDFAGKLQRPCFVFTR